MALIFNPFTGNFDFVVGGSGVGQGSAFVVLDQLTIEAGAVYQVDTSALVVLIQSPTGNHSMVIRNGSTVEIS